jgi:hypothetical protein
LASMNLEVFPYVTSKCFLLLPCAHIVTCSHSKFPLFALAM